MNSLVNNVFRICERKWVEICGKYSFLGTDKKMDLHFNNKKNMNFDIEAQQFVGENGTKCMNNEYENYFDWKYRNLDNDEESNIIIVIDY
jgi:hypothetical protein